MMAAPVKARTIIDVEIVEAGGSDSDQNLTGFRLWRRNLLVTEHIRAAEFMYADCSHQLFSRLLKSLICVVGLNRPRLNVLEKYASARRFSPASPLRSFEQPDKQSFSHVSRPNSRAGRSPVPAPIRFSTLPAEQLLVRWGRSD